MCDFVGLCRQLDCANAPAVLLGLLEMIVDRLADLIERQQGEADALAAAVFDGDRGEVSGRRGRRRRTKRQPKPFEDLLSRIGRQADLAARVRESLLSLNRLLTYLGHVVADAKGEKALRARLKTAQRDIGSLSDHVNALYNQIVFLLDATLGMISIEQNAIIKFFSVVAVVFMPPTLVASIYGMNFHNMPELSWPFGYPMALALMVASAVLPIWFFRRQGWL